MPRTGDNPFFKGATRMPSLSRVSSPHCCLDLEYRPSSSPPPTLSFPSPPSLPNELWNSIQPTLTAPMTWSQRCPSMYRMLDAELEQWQAAAREKGTSESDLKNWECAIDDSAANPDPKTIPKPLTIQKPLKAAIPSTSSTTESPPSRPHHKPSTPTHRTTTLAPLRPRRPSPQHLPSPSDLETLDLLFALNPSNQLTPLLSPPPSLFPKTFTLRPSLHSPKPASPSPPTSPLTAASSPFQIRGSLARNPPLPTETTLSELRRKIREMIDQAAANPAGINRDLEMLEPRVLIAEQGKEVEGGSGRGSKEQGGVGEERKRKRKRKRMEEGRGREGEVAPRLPRTMSLQRLSMDWSLGGCTDDVDSRVQDLKSKVSFRDLKTHVKRAETWGMGSVLRDREIGTALRSSV